ncbi:zinc protease [Cupriavidus basilensis]|uniref:Zinc protease n=2 Tax=Cupriavidus basilensis TaxID=68895 RepID=A0A0C4YMA1_9BURK|nr:zinc protease [Cupriavidus basilensis]
MALRARQQLESATGPALPLPCRAPQDRTDLRDKGANPDFEFRMRLVIKRLSLLLALAFSVSANAAPGVAHAPAPAAAKLPGAAPAEVVSVEGITEYRLPNGLRVLLAPDAAQPVATVNMTYLVGSRHENYGETGMAHLLEHLLFKGTPALPGNTIAQELTRRGMQFNGTTAFDRTNYYESFTASEENLDWALKMEADRMVNSFIAREALDSEMTVVRNEMERAENNPAGMLMQQMRSAAYRWHNYGKAPIGARSDVEHVAIGNLQEFYRRYYQPDNAVLVVAGKFDVAATLARIGQYFGAIPRPTRALPVQYTVEPPQEGAREVTLRRVGDSQLVAVQYHIAPGAHPDTVALQLLADILTDGSGGRLYKALVESGKASWQSGSVSGMKDPGSVLFAAGLSKTQDLEAARQVLVAQVEGFAARPVTQVELDRARTRLLNSYERLLENPSGYAIALSEAIAKGDWRLLLVAHQQAERVTLADLQRVAQNYLRASNCTLGRFIPIDMPGDAPAETLARATMPAAPDVAALVAAYQGKPSKAAVAAFDPSPDNIEAHTLRGKLANGMQFALLPKPSRGQTVNGTLILRMGDVNSLQGQDAVGSLTAAMLMRGTARLERQQIADRLSALKAVVSVQGDAEAVTVRFEARRDTLADTLALLRDILREPSLPAAEFETLRANAIAGIESGLGQPEAIASNVLGRHGNPYPLGDPRYVGTPQEDIAALRQVQLSDLRAFHTRFYGASHGQAALVGDFDREAAQAQLATLFGDWQAQAPYARIERPFVPLAPAHLIRETPDKANAIYLAALPVALTSDAPEYPALVIANRVFGASALKSRLADRLRQRDGISYSVGSFVQVGALDTNGRFGMQALYAPQNLDKLKRGVEEELSRLAAAGITPQELAQAKSGLLQQGMLARTSDSTLAGTLASQLFLGRTMRFVTQYEQGIATASVEQVNAAIRKHLDPARVVHVYAGDFSVTAVQDAGATIKTMKAIRTIKADGPANEAVAAP